MAKKLHGKKVKESINKIDQPNFKSTFTFVDPTTNAILTSLIRIFVFEQIPIPFMEIRQCLVLHPSVVSFWNRTVLSVQSRSNYWCFLPSFGGKEQTCFHQPCYVKFSYSVCHQCCEKF